MSQSELNAYLDECFAYDDELRRKGHSLDRGEALQPSRNAVTLRRKRGKVSFTDGPYAETKEQIGGFGMIEATDSNNNKTVMKLNHLNLTVTNPLETQDFLATYFGLKPMGKGTAKMAFLSDDNGMVLSMFKGVDVNYPDTFHIGFIQETEESVNRINGRLKADGFDVPPPSKQHGAWTFYFLAPGGFTIEVLH